MIELKPRGLPVWWTELRDPPAGDPIGCPISIEEMIQYLNPCLPLEVRPTHLEFIQRGKADKSSFWLWAFYGDDGRRWNLCVFSDPDVDRRRGTWMCADNNPYELSDRDYVTAIHNEEY